MLYTECIVIEVQKKYRTQKTDLNNTIFLRKLPSYSLRLVELVVKWETCLSNMYKLINGTNNTKLQLYKIHIRVPPPWELNKLEKNKLEKNKLVSPQIPGWVPVTEQISCLIYTFILELFENQNYRKGN